MAVHQIVHMIVMRYCLMAAVCSVLVFGAVCSAVVAAGAASRIRGADFQLVLIDVAFVYRVQMAIMNVVGMPAVQDRGVTALLSMLMRVVLVNFMLG